jgi:hypothetical protein
MQDREGKNVYGAKVIRELEKAVDGKFGAILAKGGDFLLAHCRCLASVLSGQRVGGQPLDRNIFHSHTIKLGANPFLPFYYIEEQQDGSFVGSRYITCPDDTDVDLSNFECCFLSYEDFLVDWKKPTCPCCKSNARVTRNGYVEYTKRVFSIFRNLVIFSVRYVCAKCLMNGGKCLRTALGLTAQSSDMDGDSAHILGHVSCLSSLGLPFERCQYGALVSWEVC